AEVHQLRNQFREYETRYQQRRDFWLTRLPPGPVREAIETSAHTPAAEVFRIANDEGFPLAASGASGGPGGPADREKANRVLREQIGPRFREHKAAIERAVKALEGDTKNKETAAAADAHYYYTLAFILGAVAVAAVGIVGWVMIRNVSTSAQALL